MSEAPSDDDYCRMIGHPTHGNRRTPSEHVHRSCLARVVTAGNAVRISVSFVGRLASAKTIPNESALSTAWRMSIECNRRSSEIRLLAPAFTEQRLADEATLQTQRGKIMVFDFVGL